MQAVRLEDLSKNGLRTTYSDSFVSLVGQTEQERIKCNVMLEQSRDFRDGVINIAYNKDYVSFSLFMLLINIEFRIFYQSKYLISLFERF